MYQRYIWQAYMDKLISCVEHQISLDINVGRVVVQCLLDYRDILLRSV
jgi:hypothetical protein